MRKLASDIPLLTDREVWLQKSVMDQEGNYLTTEDGKAMKDTVRVMPAIKKRWRKAAALGQKPTAPDARTLADRATEVRNVSEA